MSLNPVLKWAGGKRHIAEVLAQKLPTSFNTYFEPFIGGAAFFLHLDHRPSVVGDINIGLTNFYGVLRESTQGLMSSIRAFAESFDALDNLSQKASYYSVRDAFNGNLNQRRAGLASLESRQEDARNFYVLNKLAFNGLYRENQKGLFNVPFNGRKSFPPVDEQRFLAMAQRLSGTTILTADFETVTKDAADGDFVYFDPPYVPLTPSASFTSYSRGGFGLEEQNRLSRVMSELADRGVKAMLSNSATPIAREIYSDFRVDEIEAPRVISSKAATRGSVMEIVVRNYK